MAKVYSKVNWGTNTQVSVQSLSKMDEAIDAIDTKTQNLNPTGLTEDFASGCTVNGNVVSSLSALKFGRVITISFSFKPISVGWVEGFLSIPDVFKPLAAKACSVSPQSSNDASAKRFMTLTDAGKFSSWGDTVPTNAYNVLITYIV